MAINELGRSVLGVTPVIARQVLETDTLLLRGVLLPAFELPGDDADALFVMEGEEYDDLFMESSAANTTAPAEEGVRVASQTIDVDVRFLWSVQPPLDPHVFLSTPLLVCMCVFYCVCLFGWWWCVYVLFGCCVFFCVYFCMFLCVFVCLLYVCLCMC